jgi:hypothetical protein
MLLNPQKETIDPMAGPAPSRGLSLRGPRGGPEIFRQIGEDKAMGTRKRTARRFQVEAMEPRLAPGGASGGVLRGGMTCHIGEEIPQRA